MCRVQKEESSTETEGDPRRGARGTGERGVLCAPAAHSTFFHKSRFQPERILQLLHVGLDTAHWLVELHLAGVQARKTKSVCEV